MNLAARPRHNIPDGGSAGAWYNARRIMQLTDIVGRLARVLGTSVAREHLASLEARLVMSSVLVDTSTLATGNFAASADVNDDGFTDIISSIAGPNNTSWRVGVFLGDGQGNFSQGAVLDQVAGTAQGVPLLVADFDGDLRPDILANGSTLFLNTGGGTFGAAVAQAFTNDPASAVVFNSDNDLSLDVLAVGTDGTIRVFELTGGAFAPIATVWGTPGYTIAGTGDLNNDGRNDVLVYNAAQFTAVPLLRASNGSYTQGAGVGTGSAPLLGDFNADDVPDLYFVQTPAGTTTSFLYIARGDGTGGFAAPTQTGLNATTLHGLFDLDFDSRSEVVYSNNTGSGSTSLWMAWGGPGGPNLNNFRGLGELSATSTLAYLVPGLFAGDSRTDLAVALGDPASPTPTAHILRAADGPSVSSPFVTTSDPIIPGTSLTLTLTGVAFSSGSPAAPGVRFVIDANGNGLPDGDEYSLVAAQTTPGTWSASVLVTDGLLPTGKYTVLAVVSDENGATTVSSANQLDVWYRVFYAEGWRNDASVNEYLPLVNPNDVEVTYKIYARYEVGDRDQLVAEGTIAPHSRGGVTMTEKGRSADALVRANVGYAVEVESSLALGAFFSHYDNLGTGDQQSTATGEALSNTTSTNWAFADLSTSRFDFLLFYNPYGTDATITVSFFDAAGTQFAVPMTVGGFRRAGLALRDVAGLSANTMYGATITSSGPIVACQTSYTPETGSGFTATGQSRPVGNGQTLRFDLAGFEKGNTNAPTIVVFNSAATPATLTITFSFDTADAPFQQTLVVPAGQRTTINPLSQAPAGAGFVNVHIASDAEVYVQATTEDTTRGDSTSTRAATYAADTWAFADAFMDRTLAGSKFFETLSVYNPNAGAADVTVKYLFTDGTVATRTLSIAPGRSTSLQLHLEPSVLNHAQASWYSVVVTGSLKTVATLSHWDLLQGGGWSSLGTSLGGIEALP